MKEEKQRSNVEEETNSNLSSELIHREPIEHTPFWIVGNEELGYKLVMSKYQLTETYDTIEEVKQLLVTQKWNIISNMIVTLHMRIAEEAIKDTDTRK